jgi:hypothetical protein
MDNETSQDVNAFIASQHTDLQYTPQDMHRTNLAERAIRTWKNHFTVGLASLPKSFPIAHWCRLTNQCDYTINMLRPCRQNPLLSALEAMEFSFLFNATPMAPPGMEVLIRLKPTRHKSWSFHASNGWYIGPSLKHYCCIQAIMEGTNGKCLSDTFQFKHHAMSARLLIPAGILLNPVKNCFGWAGVRNLSFLFRSNHLRNPSRNSLCIEVRRKLHRNFDQIFILYSLPIPTFDDHHRSNKQ